jgi:hypothetical protein
MPKMGWLQTFKSPGSSPGLGLGKMMSPAQSPPENGLGLGLAQTFLAWLGLAWGFKPEPACTSLILPQATSKKKDQINAAKAFHPGMHGFSCI